MQSFYTSDTETESFRKEDSKLDHLYLPDYRKNLDEKTAELVQITPFDREGEIEKQKIEALIHELKNLTFTLAADKLSREYCQQTLGRIETSMEELHQKFDSVYFKPKKNRKVEPLRDPVKKNLFPIFLANAGNAFQRQKTLKWAQLRVAYTILYHVGLRVNEMRFFTREDIEKAIQSSQFSVVHYKTKQGHIHQLSEEGVAELKKLQLEYTTIFEIHKYKFLFGKEKPLNNKTIIRMINRDLAYTCELNSIPYNIKSHSFRINFISGLLRVTSLQNTADIIGHQDIRSTMSYRRYSLSKSQIRDLLSQSNDDSRLS